MKFTVAPLAAAAILATEALAQSMTINSLQNVVVCQPSLISWVGGTPPYFLSILPANQPAAAPLEDLGTQNGNSLTWIADLGVGTSAFLNLKDSTGLIAMSGQFTILTGPNADCVGKNPNANATSTPGNGGGGGGGGSPAPNTSGTPPASSSDTSKPSTPASQTSAPKPSNSTGAASAVAFNLAVPAIFAAVAGIVLA